MQFSYQVNVYLLKQPETIDNNIFVPLYQNFHMKHPLYLIIGFLFLACRQQKQLTVTPAPSSTSSTPSILGNWKEVSISPYGSHYENYRWMYFDDSMCVGLTYPLSYYINHDTLVIKRDTQSTPVLKLPILKLTTDSLVLLAPYPTVDFKNGRMELARITQQNTIKPTAIYFSSGKNFGWAPRMYLEIDSNRTFKFFGRECIKPTGGFHGKISDADYATILTLINNLPVSTLKNVYPRGYESQSWGMSIEWEGKLISSECAVEPTTPPELMILYFKLMDVYKRTSLQRDTTVTMSYFSQHPAAKPTKLLSN